MPIKFTDGNVVVTGQDANALAGLAIIGMVVVGVQCFKIGYIIGQNGYQIVLNTCHKIEAKLNK